MPVWHHENELLFLMFARQSSTILTVMLAYTRPKRDCNAFDCISHIRKAATATRTQSWPLKSLTKTDFWARTNFIISACCLSADRKWALAFAKVLLGIVLLQKLHAYFSRHPKSWKWITTTTTYRSFPALYRRSSLQTEEVKHFPDCLLQQYLGNGRFKLLEIRKNDRSLETIISQNQPGDWRDCIDQLWLLPSLTYVHVLPGIANVQRLR